MYRTFLMTFFICNLCAAQEKTKSVVIKYSPQHALVYCIRFDVEKMFSNTHSLVVAPMFYDGKTDKGSPAGNDALVGFGVEALHKIYVIPEKGTFRPYFAYGLNYQYLEMNFAEKDWAAFTGDDNLKYLKYDLVSRTQFINKTGLGCLFGLDMFLGKYLVLDMYIGLGYEKSFVSGTPDKYNNRYNDVYIGYSYSGFAPRTGFKIGILLF